MLRERQGLREPQNSRFKFNLSQVTVKGWLEWRAGWYWTRDDPAQDQIRAERQQEGRQWGRKEDPTLTQGACQLRFIFSFVSFKHSLWAISILASFDILNLEMRFTLLHQKKHISILFPKTKAKLVSSGGSQWKRWRGFLSHPEHWSHHTWSHFHFLFPLHNYFLDKNKFRWAGGKRLDLWHSASVRIQVAHWPAGSQAQCELVGDL